MNRPTHTPEERIALMLDLVRDLSKADKPAQVLQSYASGMIKLTGPSGYISLSCRGLKPGEYRITRLRSDDDVDDMYRDDTWSNPEKPAVHRGGWLGQVVTGGQPCIFGELQLDNDPVLGSAISAYRSAMALPLFENGQVLNWGILLRRERDVYTPDDLESGLLRGNLVGSAVRHVLTNSKLREANATIRSDIERIASIQRALLPPGLPHIPGLDVAVSYETFDTAGGDMYEFHELGTVGRSGTYRASGSDGRWGFMLGDVSGHGPAAAVGMAVCNTLLQAYPHADHSLLPIAHYLNTHLCARRIDDIFITALFGNFNATTRELTYCCAGHPPPLLRRASSDDAQRFEVRELPHVGGLPLGVLPDATFDAHTVTLEPEDMLLCYTDGMIEARSAAGEFFGRDGLIAVLESCPTDPPEAIRCILETLSKHEGKVKPQDDRTMILMRLH